MAFEPSARTRRKNVKSASKLLAPGTTIRELVFGRGTFRWSTGAIVTLAVYGALFVVALALGVLLFPGFIVIIVFLHHARPPRAVVVADEGVALLARSVWTGRPNAVLALLPHYVVALPAPGDDRQRAIGPDVVKFSRKELARLHAAVPQPTTAPPAEVQGLFS